MELSASRDPPRIGKPAGGNCQISEWFNQHLTRLCPLCHPSLSQSSPQTLAAIAAQTPLNNRWITLITTPGPAISLYLHGISGKFKEFPVLYQHPVATSSPPGNCNAERENLASHRRALTPNGQQSSPWELAHTDNRHINLLVIYALSYSLQGCLSRFLEREGKKQSKQHYFDLLPGQMFYSEYAHPAGTKITRI